MSKFYSWNAFSNFEKEVKQSRRYIRTQQAEQFLSFIRNTCRLRTRHLSSGRHFWRAQSGHSWRFVEEINDEIPAAFGPDRMKPLTDSAFEGRANPKGIPVLYLCTNKDAAMSEVRPWLGSMISLARLRITKDLRVVNCMSSLKREPHFLLEENQRLDADEIVWSGIDQAFTTPITRNDDTGEYVATQILAELFKDEGFDGIAYRSAFGKKSMNLALFDLDCAEVTGGQLFEVTSAKINFRERDNPYWVQAVSKNKSRKTKKR